MFARDDAGNSYRFGYQSGNLIMKRTMALAMLLLCHSLAAESELPKVKIDPADPEIHYSGRWERSKQSAPWCAWQGSAIKATFRGTAINAEFESDRNEYVRIIVDRDVAKSRKIQLAEGKQCYVVATELTDGEHQVELVKETYSGKGRLTFHGFHIVGEGILKPLNPKPRLRIEFYGDSNLAGHSLEHEKNKGGAAYTGCFYTYAGIVSRMLDAEYHNISRGGAIIAGRLNSVTSFYNRVDFYEAEPRWDYYKFPADICVINIGANDINRKSKQQIKQDYRTLIASIRKVQPKAHIVIMNGYGWSRDEPANYTQEVVDEIDDPNLSRLVFPWLFNEWHGCEYDHAGMARSLVDHLTSLDPNWKPLHPMDVMDGFGRHGNVANGSFELVVPFGGYGWRYFQDGAQRIHDAAGSHDGEWYLRLPEGKQVHQPNPAKKGNRYTYKLHMRGKEKGAVAKIRIEFRDQEWRNEIPDTAKEFTFELDNAWKEYTAAVDAPDGPQPSDASRVPWQIIIRLTAETGAIDCDDVQLSNAKLSQNIDRR